jgi:hypothetical protein
MQMMKDGSCATFDFRPHVAGGSSGRSGPLANVRRGYATAKDCSPRSAVD